MTRIIRKLRALCFRAAPAVAGVVMLAMISPNGALADEADAKQLLKNMSDYMAAQDSFSFDFDSVLGVVTDEEQVLELTSSGSLALERPGLLHVSRSGGFSSHESFYDGETLTFFGRNANVFTQLEVPGSIDDLINTLVNKYGLPLPAADLLLTNSYDVLMDGVTDIKDLGSGVIGGVECDFLAFRNEDVDWQIWIAQGDEPYPCRFVINSRDIAGSPQYSVQLNNWQAGEEIDSSEFVYTNTTKATRVQLEEFQKTDFPKNFSMGNKK